MDMNANANGTTKETTMPTTIKTPSKCYAYPKGGPRPCLAPATHVVFWMSLPDREGFAMNMCDSCQKMAQSWKSVRTSFSVLPKEAR